MSTTLPYC